MTGPGAERLGSETEAQTNSALGVLCDSLRMISEVLPSQEPAFFGSHKVGLRTRYHKNECGRSRFAQRPGW